MKMSLLLYSDEVSLFQVRRDLDTKSQSQAIEIVLNKFRNVFTLPQESCDFKTHMNSTYIRHLQINELLKVDLAL